MQQVLESLMPIETARLAELETIIERGLATFVDVGNALLVIRDARLYRETHDTFEDYCQERWGMSRSRAHRLIEAAEVSGNLLPMGNNPANERQIRPLTRLEPELQREAWQRVIDTAPNGKVTAAHVQAVVDEMTAKDEEDLGGGISRCPNCGNLYDGTAFPSYCPYCVKKAHNITGWVQRETMDDLARTSPGPFVGNTYQPVAVTMFSHRSVEYYTPVEILDASREVLGAFDLDPASCSDAQKNVQAAKFYTKDDDGLSLPWFGRVWLNPPYGKTGGTSNQQLWSERLANEYRAGNVTEAILLVKAALGYVWFEDLFRDWPVCFLRSRLSFILENGDDDGQSKQGTALFYFGPNFAKFARTFAQYGRIIPNEETVNATMFR